ncbi:Uncharacterized protein HZ326_9874 [Fusarium oxysporum f. sp. albedinis]|nr:Uncharacterized protein HZ326_9874 [Fusarium oxysporum f. sp. albedinis]
MMIPTLIFPSTEPLQILPLGPHPFQDMLTLVELTAHCNRPGYDMDVLSSYTNEPTISYLGPAAGRSDTESLANKPCLSKSKLPAIYHPSQGACLS